MFIVIHILPYSSDAKEDTKGSLNKCFQTTSTIYLNNKGSHDSQLNKMRQMEASSHIHKKNRNIRFVFKMFGLICGLYKSEIVPSSRYYFVCGVM